MHRAAKATPMVCRLFPPCSRYVFRRKARSFINTTKTGTRRERLR